VKRLEMEKTTEIKNSGNEKEFLDKSDNWIIEITQYTDPYCTWCWGSEPIVTPNEIPNIKPYCASVLIRKGN